MVEQRSTERTTMKLLPVCLILRVGLLLLGTSQSCGSDPNICPCDSSGEQIRWNSLEDYDVEGHAITNEYLCLLYPPNQLNCSWSFDKLSDDASLSVSISVCDGEDVVKSDSIPAVSKVGSWLQEHEALSVALGFNVTLDGKWTFYTHLYTLDMLEVLLPPKNLSVAINGSNLLVSWALPRSQVSTENHCFEYQLDLGDQERPRELGEALFYMEQIDPSQTYCVRIRTRMTSSCQVHKHWSEWSDPACVEQSHKQLNILVILSISLGIPMILLAAMLLLRRQRVIKVWFPPIPRPPPKYIHFLKRNDTVDPFYAAPSVKPAEEEITEVEYTEPNSGKTLNDLK